MTTKKDLKIAGVVTLYNPTDEDIKNIDTYLGDIDRLYIVDNTEGHDNKKRLPKSEKIEYIFKNEISETLKRNIWIKKKKDLLGLRNLLVFQTSSLKRQIQ